MGQVSTVLLPVSLLRHVWSPHSGQGQRQGPEGSWSTPPTPHRGKMSVSVTSVSSILLVPVWAWSRRPESWVRGRWGWWDQRPTRSERKTAGARRLLSSLVYVSPAISRVDKIRSRGRGVEVAAGGGEASEGRRLGRRCGLTVSQDRSRPDSGSSTG